MSHKKLRLFSVKVSVLGYFPLCVCICVTYNVCMVNVTNY